MEAKRWGTLLVEEFFLGESVWFLGKPDDDKYDSLAVYIGARPSVAVMMFTDEDLAIRVIADLDPALTPVRIQADIALLGLMLVLERKGCTHVLVDQSFGKGQFHAIGRLAREIATWFDS